MPQVISIVVQPCGNADQAGQRLAVFNTSQQHELLAIPNLGFLLIDCLLIDCKWAIDLCRSHLLSLHHPT